MVGLGPERGRAGKGDGSPNEGKRKAGWENGGERGTRQGSGPCGAEPGRGCLQDKGAPERPGIPRRSRGPECAPDARGPGAAGLVMLSPSFARTCGLGWVPRIGDQGGGRGPGGAALCGKVAGSACGGTMGAGICCSQPGEPPGRVSSTPQLALCDFLPHLPTNGWKSLWRPRVRKRPLFLGGSSIDAKIIDPRCLARNLSEMRFFVT